MGHQLAVRLHVASAHQPEICPICCSLSPVFQSQESYLKHLMTKHPTPATAASRTSSSRGASQPGFPCHECHVGSPSDAKDGSGTGQSNVVYFESVQSFIEHLQKVHHKEAIQPLHAMHHSGLLASDEGVADWFITQM